MSSSKQRRRRSSITETLNTIDEALSKPVFFLGLPKYMELVFSIPANLFGTTACLVLGPSWIALLALTQTEAHDCYFSHPFSNNIFKILLLRLVAYLASLVYAVSWAYFYQLKGEVKLGLGLFWNKNLYALAYPWSVLVMGATVYGLVPDHDDGFCTTGAGSSTAIASAALYPLVMWPPVVFGMDFLKSWTGRHRPAKKDMERRNSVAASRKAFPMQTRILATYDGTKSFPSGDVAMAAMTAIPVWELGMHKIAVAMVVSSALGRMYVLAHHLSDVTAGFALAVAVHRGFLLVGYEGMKATSWWHPLVAIAGFIFVMSRTKKVKNPLENQAGKKKSPIYSAEDD